MQIDKVDVSYEPNGKVYSFFANGLALKKGDTVVVDTVRGAELAYVVKDVEYLDNYKYAEQLKKVLRIATPKDIEQKKQNIEKEKDIKLKTENLSAELGLDLKVANAELNLDQSKVVINFTSDGRVDFRELVKKLASIYRCRIELHQIGQRNEAQLLGGLGPCGREICCSRFLKDFDHATIKMAKNQGLSLNPNKISGLCGRLMCCLSYENENYLELMKNMPKINSSVKTPNGVGKVVYNNLLKQTVDVKFEKGDSFEIINFTVDEISNVGDNDGTKAWWPYAWWA